MILVSSICQGPGSFGRLGRYGVSARECLRPSGGLLLTASPRDQGQAGICVVGGPVPVFRELLVAGSN